MATQRASSTPICPWCQPQNVFVGSAHHKDPQGRLGDQQLRHFRSHESDQD